MMLSRVIGLIALSGSPCSSLEELWEVAEMLESRSEELLFDVPGSSSCRFEG